MSADAAYELEQKVMTARLTERSSWIPLAAALYSFHAVQAWKDLGHERFTDWIADPELALGRRQAYRMIAAWAWALDNQISTDELARCDITKLAAVLPAHTRGDVDADELLSDVQALSRADLIEKYAKHADGAANVLTAVDADTETCQQCGRTVRVLDEAGTRA